MGLREKKHILSRAKTLLKSVDELKRDNDANSFYSQEGLCSNLNTNNLETYFKKWKHYSGNAAYPIKLKRVDPRDSFENSTNKYSGKYGKKRIKLLKFIIKSLKKDLRK